MEWICQNYFRKTRLSKRAKKRSIVTFLLQKIDILIFFKLQSKISAIVLAQMQFFEKILANS